MNLPDTAFLDVSHLVNAFSPNGRTPQAAEMREGPPASFCRPPACVDVHDGLNVHVIVESIMAEAVLTQLTAADVLE